jgi:hypothetical protein
MSLLDGLQPPRKNYPCKVRTYLSELDPKDVKILEEAVADLTNWKSKTLSNALQSRGIMLTDLTITRHRQNLCSCATVTNA